MSLQDATASGDLRWYVHRVYGRPTRFGEYRPKFLWVITPIIGGTGSEGIRVGADVPMSSRRAALNYAHRLAARTYRSRKARP